MTSRSDVSWPFHLIVGFALMASIGCGEPTAKGAEGSALSRMTGELGTCTFEPIASSSAGAKFTNISDLDVDSKGRIYVSDFGKPIITVLSGEGAVLRSIGRRGKGPGEFDYVVDLQLLSDDSLMVYDRGLRRITVFAPITNEVAYTINLAATSPLRPPSSVWRLSNTGQYLVTSAAPFSASGDPAEDYSRYQITHLLNADGSVLRDSILTTRAGQTALIARGMGGGITAMGNPFGRPGDMALGTDKNIYYGWGDSLAIEVYSLSGQRVGGFSLQYEPPAVAEQDIAEILETESEVTTFRKPLNAFLTEHANGTWPTFKDFVVDDRGLIWIGLVTPNDEPTQWTAFTESGDRICAISLPSNVKLELIRGDNAYGVITDELDVPHIVVYDIDGLQSTEKRRVG